MDKIQALSNFLGIPEDEIDNDYGDHYTVRQHRVLRGNSPDWYIDTVGTIKKVLEESGYKVRMSRGRVSYALFAARANTHIFYLLEVSVEGGCLYPHLFHDVVSIFRLQGSVRQQLKHVEYPGTLLHLTFFIESRPATKEPYIRDKKISLLHY